MPRTLHPWLTAEASDHKPPNSAEDESEREVKLPQPSISLQRGVSYFSFMTHGKMDGVVFAQGQKFISRYHVKQGLQSREVRRVLTRG